MKGMNGKWKLAAVSLMLAALALLFQLGKPKTEKAPSTNRRTTAAENRPGTHDAPASGKTEPTRRKTEREQTARTPGRSKRQLIQEAQRVFGQAEAARTTKLAERAGPGATSYLYVAEQPSQGEVQTVKAQIADLRSEVAPEDREDFDRRLQEEIESYDPYGEQDRKAFLIRVPMEGAEQMLMSAAIMEADNIEEFRAKFLSGESASIQVRQTLLASYDKTTLERFDQLMVWEPEKPE
jgi:hypothetical protein